MINYIYGLCEKGTNNIRYVGKTNNLKRRLNQHIKESEKNKTHKHKWINKVIGKGSEIDIIIIKIVGDDWQEHEIETIQKYENLTNHSIGGYGGKPIKYNISYANCKKYIQDNYNIKSKTEWNEYIKENLLDDFIPRSPRETYLNRGWISWGDFLGTNNTQDNKKALKYLSYNDAKSWIKNNLKCVDTIKKWKENINMIPEIIPNRPERFYKNRGWISWGDFLGTNRIANQNKIFVSYTECKEYALRMNIKNRSEWNKTKLPNDIPSNPDKKYKNKGWISWGDFLK